MPATRDAFETFAPQRRTSCSRYSRSNALTSCSFASLKGGGVDRSSSEGVEFLKLASSMASPHLGEGCPYRTLHFFGQPSAARSPASTSARFDSRKKCPPSKM